MNLETIVELTLAQDREFFPLINAACADRGKRVVIFVPNHRHKMGLVKALTQCALRWVHPKGTATRDGVKFEFPLSGVSSILVREADYGLYPYEKDADVYDSNHEQIDAPHAPYEFLYTLTKR